MRFFFHISLLQITSWTQFTPDLYLFCHIDLLNTMNFYFDLNKKKSLEVPNYTNKTWNDCILGRIAVICLHFLLQWKCSLNIYWKSIVKYLVLLSLVCTLKWKNFLNDNSYFSLDFIFCQNMLSFQKFRFWCVLIMFFHFFKNVEDFNDTCFMLGGQKFWYQFSLIHKVQFLYFLIFWNEI